MENISRMAGKCYFCVTVNPNDSAVHRMRPSSQITGMTSQQLNLFLSPLTSFEEEIFPASQDNSSFHLNNTMDMADALAWAQTEISRTAIEMGLSWS
jgi:hypothetical protein